MAEHPFFPMATDAYLADCGHLTDAEHGRYHLLLYAIWRAPEQRLPNDDAWLARRFNRSVERIQEELRPLIQEFCQNNGNWITQKRLSQEFAYVTAQRKKQSDRAKSRWNKEKESYPGNAAPHAFGNAGPHQSGTALYSTPLHSTLPKEEITNTDRIERGGAVAPAPQKTKEARHGNSGTRIPEAWRPCPAGRAFAAERGIDPDSTADAFVDWWTAASGAKAVKRDWDAAFRTWCRRDSISSRGSPGPSTFRAPRGNDAFYEQLAVIANRGRD